MSTRPRREIVEDLTKRLGRKKPFHIGNVSHWKNAGAPIDDPEKLEAWYRERHPPIADPSVNGSASKFVSLKEEDLQVKIRRGRIRLARESGALATMDSVDRIMVSYINDARTLLEAAPEAACMLVADLELRALLFEEWKSLVDGVLRSLAAGSQAVRDNHEESCK